MSKKRVSDSFRCRDLRPADRERDNCHMAKRRVPMTAITAPQPIELLGFNKVPSKILRLNSRTVIALMLDLGIAKCAAG
ncbi:hypothetical protein TNIN_30421 [Trichonephila inaurata madagascariensis]|uniref:Uncharacterized protein n=1 Tax=Trichonephila inaurata madagascariensis TaxID=2747483 RepID=A0A8X6YCQ7_9ARAC|nr:hypothetical protein TNIN_30421 [Trichonephila inaurata madagascariensis]